jgi:serine/threonine protein kinase
VAIKIVRVAATDDESDTSASVPVPVPAGAALATGAVRLAREVAILRALNHPNIVRLFDVVSSSVDGPYGAAGPPVAPAAAAAAAAAVGAVPHKGETAALILSFAEGHTLDEWVAAARGGRLPIAPARHVYRQVRLSLWLCTLARGPPSPPIRSHGAVWVDECGHVSLLSLCLSA